MKITSSGHTCHLACGTDTRPGEDWATHFARLRRHVAGVRAATSSTTDDGEGDPGATFALTLRLTTVTLAELEDGETLDRLRAWLDAERCHVVTLGAADPAPDDGSPPADDHVPDWSGALRLDYTRRLMTLLARLDPPDARGSISTPLGLLGPRPTPEREAAMVENLLRALAHGLALERDTGARVELALRPEPGTRLANADAVVSFVEGRLLGTAGVQRMAALTGLAASGARQALHRHLGICHDACRSAVEFESPLEALERYAASDIEVLKLELGSALHVRRVNEAALRRLQRFDEPRRLRRLFGRGHR